MSDQDEVSIQNTLTSSRILTEKIGNLKTKNGQTISEYFDVDGINIWTALEPYIALYLIPHELSKNLNPNLNNKLRPHLSLAKSRVFNFFKSSAIELSILCLTDSSVNSLLFGPSSID